MLSRQCMQFISCSRRLNNIYSLSSVFSFSQSKVWIQTRMISTPSDNDKFNEIKKHKFTRFSRFNITMSKEEKERKKKEIEILKAEEKPEGLVAKFKFYFKRYWYIALPVHCVSCLMWFTTAFMVVKSGVDVIALLQWLHIPDILIEKVKNTPKSAGVLVVALILYKIATPLRYATTLAGIQLTFKTLKRFGKLRMAKEVEYRVRSEYEKYSRAIRRINERRLANVSSKTSRKKSNQ